MEKMRKIILASTSERRKELLTQIGVPFVAIDSGYEEDLTLNLPPIKLVKHLSKGKAQAVAQKFKDELIIGADQIIVFKNEVIGKPKNRKEAELLLKNYRKNRQEVITAYTIIDSANEKSLTKACTTQVYFRDYTEKEIKAYLDTGEPLDKAGGYAIQGKGALFVDKIVGDYYTIVGLPLASLYEDLKKFGINILTEKR